MNSRVNQSRLELLPVPSAKNYHEMQSNGFKDLAGSALLHTRHPRSIGPAIQRHGLIFYYLVFLVRLIEIQWSRESSVVGLETLDSFSLSQSSVQLPYSTRVSAGSQTPERPLDTPAWEWII